MKLSHELAKIFEREIEIVINKEIAEPDFLKSEEFKTSEDRARAGVGIAMEAVVKALALADATHREVKHDENTMDEQATLMASMADADVEVSVRGWWSE